VISNIALDVVRRKNAVSESVRREELKNFLRTRRARLSPADFGLPEGTRRRTPGLRRDEVAQLASIGTTTYTFLEQGRDIRVSTHVLDKIAEVLRLSEQEKQHLFRLAVGEVPEFSPLADEPNPALLVMLENLGVCPGLLLNYRFDVIATNKAANLVFGYQGKNTDLERNVLWRLVNDPRRKTFYDNHDDYFKYVLAYFRWMYTQFVGDEELARFIQSLKDSSEEFLNAWNEHEVLDSSMLLTPLRINHPKLGAIEGVYVLLTIFGYPNFTLCVFTPTPQTDSAKKITQTLEINGDKKNGA
jgi:hypothetical protein